MGMLLRPYSLGHELWLLRENNSVLRGTIDGLPAAVLICSQTWDELKAMRSDRLLGLKLWIWKRRTRKLDPVVELAKFHTYRNEGLLEFSASEIERPGRGSGRVLGAPFVLRLQQWLMLTLRKNESDAWDYPAGLAKMRWATHWEAEGAFDIKSADEAEFDDYVAGKKAEKAAKAAKALAKKEEAKCPA